jgi:hypothetical protein
VDGKCECGENDPNYVPSHTHAFVDGKCECGESDPGYTPATDDPQTPDDPKTPDDNKGRSAGTVVAIVAVAIVALGGGGFCLFWFIIRRTLI